MADGKVGWAKPDGYPTVELGGHDPIDLGDGRIQLRFHPVAVPGTDVKIVPTWTFLKGELESLGQMMRSTASQVPTSRIRN